MGWWRVTYVICTNASTRTRSLCRVPYGSLPNVAVAPVIVESVQTRDRCGAGNFRSANRQPGQVEEPGGRFRCGYPRTRIQAASLLARNGECGVFRFVWVG